ncbi:hypothetical protein ACJX0J_026457, partial [Zea mays]
LDTYLYVFSVLCLFFELYGTMLVSSHHHHQSIIQGKKLPINSVLFRKLT